MKKKTKPVEVAIPQPQTGIFAEMKAIRQEANSCLMLAQSLTKSLKPMITAGRVRSDSPPPPVKSVLAAEAQTAHYDLRRLRLHLEYLNTHIDPVV